MANAFLKSNPSVTASSGMLKLPHPEVQVNFRPSATYNGEYGFDWIRMGDTRRNGDKDWYYNLVGNYYLDAAFTRLNTDINGWTVNWRKEADNYNSWVRSFKKKIDIKWKKDAGQKDFLYPVPMITLIPNDNEAILDVNVEMQRKPKKIILKPERGGTGVVLSVQEIPAKSGPHPALLKIKCSKELKEDLNIEVLADGKLCGQLMILKNDASVIKKINVLLVKVKSNINGTAITGRPVVKGKDKLGGALKQALIKANVTTHTSSLDVTGTTIPLLGYEWSNEFRDKFCSATTAPYTIDKSSNSLLGYLNKKFDEENKNYVATNKIDYRVYFIGDSGAWNGFAMASEKAGLYFPGHNDATIPHELMHAMNLAHTFVTKTADPFAKFTYKAGQTVNLMDYSHQISFGKMNRTSLFHWQWKILNPKIK